MDDKNFYQQNPYGSAALVGVDNVLPLTNGQAPIGTLDGEILRRSSQEPTLIVGGAGAGKFTTMGCYQILHPSTNSFLILDVGAQYMSVTWHANLMMGREAYALNVEGIGAYSDINHPHDLWAILKPDKKLFKNAKAVTEMALKDDAKGDNQWVGQGARRWLSRIKMSIVYLEGRVTPKRLWEVINQLDSDDDFFHAWGESCKGLPNQIYATLLEIYRKKHKSEKEYGAIMGMIKDNLDWLSNEDVADSVSGDVDYLALLADPNKKVGVYFVIQSVSKDIESLTRMMVGIAMLHCVQANNGARPLFYIEEAATCGSASFIKRLVSQYRKYIDTVLVYQSQGQLNLLFGEHGAQEIRDSCGMQLILGGGIRDIKSARQYADMIGKASIEVIDPAAQIEHIVRAEKARNQAILNGKNPIEAGLEYDYAIEQSQHGKLVARDAVDASELLRMNPDKILVFSPGKGVPPVLADKLPPYWKNKSLAGLYAPDPLFPPLNKVLIQGRFWSKKVPFIREDVPEHLASMPNHSNGYIAYVKGYKTWK